MLKINRKIRLIQSEHLSLGNNNWGAISKSMSSLHHDKGINCYEWLDRAFKDKCVIGPWVGFLHNPIAHPDEYPQKYSNSTISISKIVKDKYFLKSLESSKGIFVFTKQIKDYIIQQTGFSDVENFFHPCVNYSNKWFEFKKLIHVGQQFRKYHSFINVKSNFTKIMIKPKWCENDLIEMKKYSPSLEIKILDQLKLDDYLKILCESVVFIDLYDSAACNTIIECIILNVPIIVNKIPGCIEYLGEGYPGYYDDIEEASKKINDHSLIISANKYLKNMNKNNLKIQSFLNSFCSSDLYKKI